MTFCVLIVYYCYNHIRNIDTWSGCCGDRHFEFSKWLPLKTQNCYNVGIHVNTVQISFIFIVWYLTTAFTPTCILRKTQTRFELFWIGLRIRNAFGMNRNCTFCICLFSQILICDLWALGGFSFYSFKTNVSETAGQIHLSDILCDVRGIAIWVIKYDVRCIKRVYKSNKRLVGV